jgi:hypothetical protein
MLPPQAPVSRVQRSISPDVNFQPQLTPPPKYLASPLLPKRNTMFLRRSALAIARQTPSRVPIATRTFASSVSRRTYRHQLPSSGTSSNGPLTHSIGDAKADAPSQVPATLKKFSGRSKEAQLLDWRCAKGTDMRCRDQDGRRLAPPRRTGRYYCHGLGSVHRLGAS